jgi:UDP-N-acetyl-D-mannosaminuronic acid dehydrogenase
MQMQKKVGVVGGCGHVGLPLAVALAPHHRVFVYDVDAAAVERVRHGEVPFRDEGLEEELARALALGLQVKSSPEDLPDCDYIVVIIGTPVDKHLNPDFTGIDHVLGQLEEVFRKGQTLILRSTIYPGTTERTYKSLKKKNLGLEVAFCPERVAEGLALREIRSLPQIISGFSPRAVAAARALFEPLGVEILEVAPLEAELAKLFTNVYRYITFSVANQFFMLASEANVDFYRILKVMKHNYPRAAALPSAGLTAGPCLFKDTMQMSSFNNNRFFLGHAAMLVNEGLPQFIVNRMKQRWPDLSEKTVGILGMAFKAESDDARESLSYKLKKILSLNARSVLTCDPYVKDSTLLPEAEVLQRSDLFVIAAPHVRYKALDYRNKSVVDIWNHLGKGSLI